MDDARLTDWKSLNRPSSIVNWSGGVMGRSLIVLGLLIAGVGLLINLGLPIGRLPGDFTIRRGNFTFYFPLATSIIASIVLTVIMMFFSRR
jgi:hypothetical protein